MLGWICVCINTRNEISVSNTFETYNDCIISMLAKDIEKNIKKIDDYNFIDLEQNLRYQIEPTCYIRSE